jgi:hypothetical protein
MTLECRTGTSNRRRHLTNDRFAINGSLLPEHHVVHGSNAGLDGISESRGTASMTLES